jgi:lipopolysaccharide transport system permease protein
MTSGNQTQWNWEISSKTSWWEVNWKEWWVYRHLLGRLVRREFLLNYQQTILGPVWVLLQPVLTLGVFLLVFGKIIGVNTGGVPPVLFFLAGIVLWNFFNESFLGTAFVFVLNAELYRKVYFPRLILPAAALISHAIRFFIQFLLFLLVWAYMAFFRDVDIPLTPRILLVPLIVLLVGMVSFGVGIIFSILTAHYRDFNNVVHLGLRLLMFVTPTFFPASYIPQKVRWIAELNPLLSLFEAFRYAVLGEGSFTRGQLLYSILFAVIIFTYSIVTYNRQSSKLVDVV